MIIATEFAVCRSTFTDKASMVPPLNAMSVSCYPKADELLPTDGTTGHLFACFSLFGHYFAFEKM